MNVLDENIPRDQSDLLQSWSIRARSLSRDLAQQGIQDENIIPLLHQLKAPTLLTRDSDFFNPQLAHDNYALVWLNVGRSETAFYIRRFLRHPQFRRKAQRMGKVIRVHAEGIEVIGKGDETRRILWV